VRLKETSPEIEFWERFKWLSPPIRVEVDFWADEVVERFWIENIATCRCGE